MTMERTVGNYALERPIAHGGMGTVWLAQRRDGRFEGRAAIKFLDALLGPSGVERFRREGHVLARLEHANIARLIDAGVTDDDQPYLVLEYVEGESLDRWCESRAREMVRMWAGFTSGARPVGEALETVGLTDRASVRINQLSGGERRRLDLALALLGRPEVVFLDEPTTGMDPEGRQETWRLIRELRAQGTTVLLTTHYLEEAEKLADRLAIMQEGEIVASGTPAEVTSTQPARIRFTLPEGIVPGWLPSVVQPLPQPGGGPPPGGRPVEVRTHSMQETLTELLLWARESDVKLAGLEARAASLEEAFLDIARDERHRVAQSETAELTKVGT